MFFDSVQIVAQKPFIPRRSGQELAVALGDHEALFVVIPYGVEIVVRRERRQDVEDGGLY